MKKLKKILKVIFRPNTLIYIFLFVGCFSLIVFCALSKGYLDKSNFFEGIAVEGFGMSFDILVLGVIFSALYNFTESRRDTKRYLEEIDDFRGWDDKEAMFRILGNIKRLLRLGTKGKKIDLHDCYLKEADLMGANLSDANLAEADLTGADLSNVVLEETNLTESTLQEADLTRADLYRANLAGANLTGADLTEADLNGAILIGSDFTEANFTGAKNITVDQLLQADTLFNVNGLPVEIEDKLREMKPELFEEE